MSVPGTVKASEMAGKAKKNSRFKRGLRIGRLGAGLAGSYLGYQFQNLLLGGEQRDQRRKSFHNHAARKVREELQSLKGPVMKLGQILSMQSHVLPKEVISELTHLQMRAPAMHPTLARAQFKASFDQFPEDVFRTFEAEAFAAASLGQVHRAVSKDGTRLAVKIQYPAIRSAIENDFKLLRSAALPARLTGHISESILREVEQGILEETDYIHEGKNIDFFRQQLRLLDYVHVPLVHWDLATDRVLTMSFIPGEPLSDFLTNEKPSQQQRDLIGFRLLNLFSFQMHGVHAIHADPHPGNYLIQPDGAIGLVDFGCVKKFSAEFIELMKLFRQRAWLQGEEQSRRMAQLIWGRDVLKRPRTARKLLAGAIDVYHLLFPPGRHIVDFGDAKLLQRMAQLWEESMRNKMANPEFAFYSRAELGLYNLLHQLRARIDTSKAFGAPLSFVPTASSPPRE